MTKLSIHFCVQCCRILDRAWTFKPCKVQASPNSRCWRFW